MTSSSSFKMPEVCSLLRWVNWSNSDNQWWELYLGDKSLCLEPDSTDVFSNHGDVVKNRIEEGTVFIYPPEEWVE